MHYHASSSAAAASPYHLHLSTVTCRQHFQLWHFSNTCSPLGPEGLVFGDAFGTQCVVHWDVYHCLGVRIWNTLWAHLEYKINSFNQGQGMPGQYLVNLSLYLSLYLSLLPQVGVKVSSFPWGWNCFLPETASFLMFTTPSTVAL